MLYKPVVFKMKFLLLLSCLVLGVYSDPLKLDELLHSTENHWIAGNNFNEKEFLSLAGGHTSVKDLPLRKFTKKELKKDIPENYNVIDAFPQCTSIPVIKTQSNCKSCWAISVAAAFSDRLCIATEGKINTQLSAQEIISCCPKCGSCQGGCTAKAWTFTKQKGIVTGGDYGSKEGCQPYAIEPCEQNGKCAQNISDTPKCSKQSCTNKSYKTPFNQDVHKNSKIYRISSNVSDIQREILINGPVVATYDLYEDFVKYVVGIYKWKETSGNKIGEHSVKIVGWGTCKMCGMKYWIASNTWGSDWGEKGFFKIMRETNKVGFEDQISAGLPKVSKKYNKKYN